MGSGIGDEYYIVSYDKGYQSVCRYWQEKDVCVKRIESLGEGCPKKKPAPKKHREVPGAEPAAVQKPAAKKAKKKTQKNQKKKDTLLSMVKELIPDHGDAKRVADILRENTTKQDVNNALMKEFPSPENKIAAQLYKLVKPLIPVHKES